MKHLLTLLKIVSYGAANKSIWNLQLFIRFVLNGSAYPTKEQRESGTFRDYYIGWIAYRYLSKFTIDDGWLQVELASPRGSIIWLKNSHGDIMTSDYDRLKQRSLDAFYRIYLPSKVSRGY